MKLVDHDQDDLSLAERLRRTLNVSEEQEGEQLAEKIETVSVDELESVLTPAELKEFYRAAGANKVLQVQSWRPWWEPRVSTSKGIASLNRTGRNVPQRLRTILPPLESLTKKTPDPGIIYHGK